MAANNILLAKNIDVSKCTYGEVRSLSSGGKAVYVGYEGKPLVIQTAELPAPFGLSKWSPGQGKDKGAAAGQASDKPENDKYSVELSFKGRETKPSVQHFYNFLSSFDDKLVADALTNSQQWFKKKYSSEDVIRALYTPHVKFAKDKDTGEVIDKYPPTFRLSVPFRDGKPTCDIYDRNGNIMNTTDIPKGSKVTAIMQCLGLWLAGGKFGCSWKVLQLRVTPPETIKGFAFRDIDDDKNEQSDIDNGADSDDDGDFANGAADEPDIPPNVVIDAPSNQNVDNKEELIESSSDEDEDDPLEKAPAKKVVVKKKPAKK